MGENARSAIPSALELMSDRDRELQHAARIVWELRQTPARMRLDVLAIVIRLLCDGVLDDGVWKGSSNAR